MFFITCFGKVDRIFGAIRSIVLGVHGLQLNGLEASLEGAIDFQWPTYVQRRFRVVCSGSVMCVFG